MSSQISPQANHRQPPSWRAYRTDSQFEAESDDEVAPRGYRRGQSPLSSDSEDGDDSSPVHVRTSSSAALPHRRPTPESSPSQLRHDVPVRFVPRTMAIRSELDQGGAARSVRPEGWPSSGAQRRIQRETVFTWESSTQNAIGHDAAGERTLGEGDLSPPSQDSLESCSNSSERLSSVSSCVHRGVRSEYVQCLIRRDRTSKIYPYYHLLLESSQQPLLSALKVRMSRTSNYHFFDMTRGVVEGSELTKKSGNYVGKLRAKSSDHRNLVFVGRSSDREELAAMSFHRSTLIDQYVHGAAPRRMRVVLPPVDNGSMKPIANRPDDPGSRSLLDILAAGDYGRYYVFQTKDPVLENGAFKLDFGGRVTWASVKNFQLVSEDDPEHVVCQFGKCGPDAFILDFQAPFNAAQAFAVALSQFNL